MARQIYDQYGNVIRSYAVDETTGDYQFRMEMEADDMIAENFRLAARIPAPIVEKAMIEGWFHDDEAWKRWMNNGDNREFRVWEGKV